MSTLPVIFCAIDTPDLAKARAIAAAMQSVGCGIKLGLEFFCTHGVTGIESVRNDYPDLPLFLDLKFHDIPNTVAGAVRAVMVTSPDYLTLHCSGGIDMMKAAQDSALSESTRLGLKKTPALLGVTVLTSLDNAALEDVGQMTPSEHQVLRLARLTQESGLAGIVCSGLDIIAIRASLGPDFVLMVPGIRLEGAIAHDQKRVMTPIDAVTAGATHLVIGRPITGADDPAKAAQDILDTLAIAQDKSVL